MSAPAVTAFQKKTSPFSLCARAHARTRACAHTTMDERTPGVMASKHGWILTPLSCCCRVRCVMTAFLEPQKIYPHLAHRNFADPPAPLERRFKTRMVDSAST